ncbi:hypothetical protein [Prosthecomicrobium pneumaticum]|uniref:Uncharacterized protein n=1 Tax=Prosthecomicrobium pneumaticum TaxID=81895 RepID=A0A7W9FPY9_9HYPH|nr:hypothetical protein [Prosthecomicrobium pneumaticum]MBB5754636.1 hypothetical protein [Prosthecomicrobium pneumaticum]
MPNNSVPAAATGSPSVTRRAALALPAALAGAAALPVALAASVPLAEGATRCLSPKEQVRAARVAWSFSLQRVARFRPKNLDGETGREWRATLDSETRARANLMTALFRAEGAVPDPAKFAAVAAYARGFA